MVPDISPNHTRFMTPQVMEAYTRKSSPNPVDITSAYTSFAKSSRSPIREAAIKDDGLACFPEAGHAGIFTAADDPEISRPKTIPSQGAFAAYYFASFTFFWLLAVHHINLINPSTEIIDDIVKSPYAALRFILRHCDVRPSTSHSSGFVRLASGAF